MKYNFKYLTVLLMIACKVFAAFEKNEAGARELALGNAVVAMHNSPFALLYNPANIQTPNTYNVYSSYRNFYGVPDIYQANVVANMNIYDVASAFAVTKYGNDIYSETEVSAGGSYQFVENFNVGVSLQGYFLSIKNYGDAQSWGMHLGFQYNYLDKISIGAFVTNINHPKIAAVKEELPQNFSLGIQYKLAEHAAFFFELQRDVKHEQDYRAGCEYEVFEELFLRMGIMDNTNTYSFGFGSSYNFLKFDYALINHSLLGVSHAISVGVEI